MNHYNTGQRPVKHYTSCDRVDGIPAGPGPSPQTTYHYQGVPQPCYIPAPKKEKGSAKKTLAVATCAATCLSAILLVTVSLELRSIKGELNRINSKVGDIKAETEDFSEDLEDLAEALEAKAEERGNSKEDSPETGNSGPEESDGSEENRGWIGVIMKDSAFETDDGKITDAPCIDGVVVDGPAFQADIRPGDFITHVNGKAVSDTKMFIYVISQHKPGETVELTVMSGAFMRPANIKVTLVAKSDIPDDALVLYLKEE